MIDHRENDLYWSGSTATPRCSRNSPSAREASAPTRPAARRGTALLAAVIVLTALAVLVIPTGAAADKKYDHPLIEQTYRLLPDGTAEVEEVRAFRFKGDFSYAFIERELMGDYGRYRIEYLGVTDVDSGAELRTRRYEEGDRAGIKQKSCRDREFVSRTCVQRTGEQSDSALD